MKLLAYFLCAGVSLGGAAQTSASPGDAPSSHERAQPTSLPNSVAEGLVKAAKRAPAADPDEVTPEELEEQRDLDNVLEEYQNDYGQPYATPHAGGSLDQRVDAEGAVQWGIRTLMAKFMPPKRPNLKPASGEWADTFDVVNHLYAQMVSAREQMKRAHPKTWGIMSSICDLESEAYPYRAALLKAEKARNPVAIARAKAALRPFEARLAAKRGAMPADVGRWYASEYGPTMAAAIAKQPTRAMAIYLLHSLDDGEELLPGLSLRGLYAMTSTFNGEARNVDCPSTPQSQSAARTEIQRSYDRRSQHEGRKLNPKEQAILAEVKAGAPSPWWAEPCRKTQMELVGTTILNRIEAAKQNAAVEAQFMFPRRVSTGNPARAPAQQHSGAGGSTPAAKLDPRYSIYRSVIEYGSFSMWNEIGQYGGQNISCLMTGKGNYTNEHQMKSALFAMRNLFARNSQGQRFVRGTPPLSTELKYFAMPGAKISGGKQLPAMTLTEGPPPVNPRLGEVWVSGSEYRIVGGARGSRPGHIFRLKEK